MELLCWVGDCRQQETANCRPKCRCVSVRPQRAQASPPTCRITMFQFLFFFFNFLFFSVKFQCFLSLRLRALSLTEATFFFLSWPLKTKALEWNKDPADRGRH